MIDEVEIKLRYKGEEYWVPIKKGALDYLIKRNKPKKTSPSRNIDVKSDSVLWFEKWWILYDKKVGKNDALKKWIKVVRGKEAKTIYEKIMDHTKKYIEEQDQKQYRKNPTTYINQKSWLDEVIVKDKKIDLDEMYPFDTTGNARKGRCSNCNQVVFGNKYTIHKDDSDCCKVKINKYRG